MRSVALGFFIKAGGRDETPSISGVSHFLEHMVFKGTAKRTSHQINLEFDHIGADYNAVTWLEYTVYYVRVLPEFLDKALDLLADMMRPALRREDFEMEKKVILEEIALHEDQPSFCVHMQGLERFFGEHPLGNRVLGTKRSIKALKLKQMLSYFKEHYSPKNMVLACVGNYDWEFFKRLSEELCRWEPLIAKERAYPDFKPKEQLYVLHRQTEQQHIGIFMPAPPYQSKKREAAYVMASIVGGSKNSRLYWALVDQGFADVAVTSYEPLDRAGVFYTYISCEPKNSYRVLETAIDVLERDFTDEELTMARSRLMTGLVVEGEQSIHRLFPLGLDFIHGVPYRSLQDQMKLLAGVSLDDLNDLREYLKPKVTVSLGPCDII
jgi:predicted Zn-dependent peptidase